MGKGKLGFTAAAVAAVGAIGGFGVAAANITDTAKSTVKATSGGPNGAEGKVNSPEPSCEKGRTVTLFYETPAGAPGYRGTPGAQRIGSDKTNKDGEWAINEALIAGDYYVKVNEKVVEGTGKRHPATRCKPDRSIKYRF
jgi:hypothetical protein